MGERGDVVDRFIVRQTVSSDGVPLFCRY
jgi:hypothetical protein